MKYIFRGIVVFEYNPKTRQMTMPNDVPGVDCSFNFCNFIAEDYGLISKFFADAHDHANGNLHESFLKDTDVA